MKILAIFTMAAEADREAFPPLLVPEEQVLWASYRRGALREWYFQPQPLAVTLVYEVPSTEQVHAELDELPMVQAGLLDRQVITLGPWIPLEVLFAPGFRTSAE